MGNDTSLERAVVEIARHSLQAETDRAVSVPAGVAGELVGALGEVESERGRGAARRVRKPIRNPVLRPGRSAAVGHRKGTFEDRQAAHVEDVAAQLGAWEPVIDEVEHRLFHVVGMRGHIGEIAAERGLERLRMTERTNCAGECGKRGSSLRHQAIVRLAIDQNRQAWGGQPGGRLQEARPMDVRSRNEACACEDQRKRAQESVLEVFSQSQSCSCPAVGAPGASLNDQRQETTRSLLEIEIFSCTT